MKQINKKGFTLIELMIVIAIIGVLATAGISQYSKAQAKSRDMARVMGLKSVNTALIQFQSDYGEFPVSTSVSGIAGCFSRANGTFNAEAATDGPKMKEYYDNGKAPLDPNKGNKVKGCNEAGSYGYQTLRIGGDNNLGFLILADVESTGQVNMNAEMVEAGDNANEVSAISTLLNGTKGVVDGNTENGVYGIMNGQ